MKTCAFFGHRKVVDIYEIENRLLKIIETLIKEGFVRFLVGSHGEFDKLCLNACLNLKKKYNHIKIEYVITNFLNLTKDESGVSDYTGLENVNVISYNIEDVHFKRRIEISNRCMIDDSDIIVCYIRDKEYISGAVKAIKYAVKSGKRIINLKI